MTDNNVPGEAGTRARAVFDRAALLEITAAGAFGSLTGGIEGLEFECKAQPYQVTTEAGTRA